MKIGAVMKFLDDKNVARERPVIHVLMGSGAALDHIEFVAFHDEGRTVRGRDKDLRHVFIDVDQVAAISLERRELD